MAYGYRRRIKLFPIVGLLFGVYCLNFKFQFFITPQFLLNFNDWIITFSGVLLIILGLKDLFSRSNRYASSGVFSK